MTDAQFRDFVRQTINGSQTEDEVRAQIAAIGGPTGFLMNTMPGDPTEAGLGRLLGVNTLGNGTRITALMIAGPEGQALVI